METIEATYRIVTPMFIGGANQDPSDGIRPPSFKGALRFWWRALNWGKYQDLTELHKKECDLFGSAAKDKKGGQGVFQLVLQARNLRSGNPPKECQWQSYLLGQGLWHFKTGCLRPALLSGEVDVRVRFRPNTCLDDTASVANAMKCLGMLGGLGVCRTFRSIYPHHCCSVLLGFGGDDVSKISFS